LARRAAAKANVLAAKNSGKELVAKSDTPANFDTPAPARNKLVAVNAR
jgi:hypothetical protein